MGPVPRREWRGAPRRGFLSGMLRAAGLLALARVPAATASGAAARGAGGAPPSASDLRIARLGARLARQDPAIARRLARAADAELPAWLRLAGVRRRARTLRRRLLDPARLAREWDAGAVQVVDGWVLARSEAAVAAWLDAHLGPDPRA